MTNAKQRRIAAVLGAVLAAVFALTAGLLLAPRPGAEPALLGPASGDEPYRLDLNDASAEELQGLPGVGPVLAENILARRSELGGFRTKEDVLSVPGIGEAAWGSIAPYIAPLPGAE